MMKNILTHTLAIETQSDKGGPTFHHITLASRDRPEIFVVRTVRAARGGMIHPDDLAAVLNDLWPSWIRLLRDRTRAVLTRTQLNSYQHILEFWRDEGRAPTQDELADMTNTSKAAAGGMIARLERAGWIWRDEERRPVPYDLALPDGE